MRIGELGSACDLPTRTIRFYERRGLLPEPQRSANGYRTYDEASVSRLRFIRAAQAAGLTLAEIQGVTELRDEGSTPCEHVHGLLETKLLEIRDRIIQLQGLAGELQTLIARSNSLDPAECTKDSVCHILQTDTADHHGS
jgi:MerR family mercuric resistance operon transcriptional regulator